MSYQRQNFENNKTVLTAEHLNNIEDGIVANEESIQELEAKIPTKVSELENDKSYLTDYEETDPTVPNWAKQPNKPTYTAEEVGADPEGTAASKVAEHNTKTDAHNDIRLLITGLTNRLNALADSDDTTLDQMGEIVAYIKANRDLIDNVTTAKVNVDDIINNLTTNVENKPLSAAQGVILKGLIDGLQTSKLDASKLTESISTALAQAKASGEFKGDRGDKGDKGDKGDPYTLTDTDKNTIVNAVINALPTTEGVEY